MASRKKHTLKRAVATIAWDAMWGGYIRALKSGNLKRAAEFKRHIDSFNAKMKQ